VLDCKESIRTPDKWTGVDAAKEEGSFRGINRR